MKVKLYVDEDVHDKFAEALRKCGVDAESVKEADRRGLKDAEQLAYAVSQQRAILTFNRVHFEELAVEYFESGLEHYGIIISPQYEFGELLRRVLQLLESTSAEELRNQIRYLQSME